MQTLTIHHKTVYRYKNPVRFGEHQLMLRPRDSHDLRLVESRLTTTPTATVRWWHDVFSNSIAEVTFDQPGDCLTIDSVIVVEDYGLTNQKIAVKEFARTLPFSYDPVEIPDLGRTIERHFADPERKLDAWSALFMNKSGPTYTVQALKGMTEVIRDSFLYTRRTEPGVQSPVETLERGSGTCRDFAVLLMEAARGMGLAARFVTGYLYDPAVDGFADGATGGGETHAWAQIYLPGAGWVEFDPTNGRVGGSNLIRVAVARDPAQALPVSGTFTGYVDDFDSMDVWVTVRRGNWLTPMAVNA